MKKNYKQVLLFGADGGIGEYFHNFLPYDYPFFHIIPVTRQDLDITSEKEFEKFYHDRISGKKIDIVISAIGYTYIANILDMPQEEMLKTYKVNVIGNFNILKYTFPIMSKTSKYIFLGSVSASKVFSGMSAYASSKFGLSALLQCAIREFNKTKHIQIFMVNPATLKRGSSFMTQYQFDTFKKVSKLTDKEIDERLISQIPAGRLVKKSDIYNWIKFLVSDEATMSSSQIEITGGMTF